jgi:UPF0755 protein
MGLFGRGGGDEEGEDQQPRSADEHQGDRAERERRALREGDPAAQENGDRDEWEWEDQDGDDHGGTADQPTAAFSIDDEPATEHGAPESRGGHPDRRTVRLPRSAFDDENQYELPIGTRRAGRPPYSPQPGAAPPGYLHPSVPRRPRGRRVLAAFAVLLLLACGAVLLFAWLLFQPGKGDGTGTVRVVIPPGSTASQIGDRLAAAGVVDSGFFFDLRTRLSGHRTDLRAGRYRLRHDMSYAAAIDELTTPPRAVPVLNVTLPEGPSRRELAPIVRRAGVRGRYLRASAASPRLDPRAYGAPRTASLEGFLFPATYELRRSRATAKRLVARQLAAFKQNIKKVDRARARRAHLSVYDILIIASMIEREARVARERPLISAVIHNRLRQGIPLGIDATIRYYEHNWTRPLRRSELERDSPYNTRKRQGLPPTPIGNPGLASIRAAADPARVNYIFYVVKPCGNGAHNFSSTNAQFLRDVAAYNRKRDELGGKDPSTCKG